MKLKNSTLRAWFLTLFVTMGIIGAGFIPAAEIFGITLQPVDILSDIKEPSEGAVEYEADIERLEMELAALAEVSDTIAIDTLPELPPVRYEWLADKRASYERRVPTIDLLKADTTHHIIAIEDFDTLSTTRFERLVEKLASGEDVRIAFMGDSFVEGDILTSDLRSELQQSFGGRGVDFVPCDIPFATARRSVKRSASGWSSYSVMKPKSAPESLRDLFFISGYISEGKAGAKVRWQSTDIFPTIDSCSRARILLVSRDTSRVVVTLNDTLSHEVEIAGDERLREIYIEAPYKSLSMRVAEGKVVCYGASLEGDGGVAVDNFSVRSNNGHAIFGTGAQINRQAHDMLSYDLVVLQYGLNIMMPGQRNFSKYRDQLRDMIAYTERCFPNAAILVLGVSDRWIKDEETGRFKPIGSVDALTRHQRAAADSSRVAFWNTSEAMADLGGMPAFVRNGWAAGDYTHLNYAGGRRIAEALARSIRKAVYDCLVEREEERQREEQRRMEEELIRQIRIDLNIANQREAVTPIINAIKESLPTDVE